MLNRIYTPSVSHVADVFLSHSFGGSHPVQPGEMKTELLDTLRGIKPLGPTTAPTARRLLDFL
jgi:hypothetical protein